MPIEDAMDNMSRKANEPSQTFRSEISNLGSFALDSGAAVLGYATDVASSIAVPTSDSEVIHCPAAQQWVV